MKFWGENGKVFSIKNAKRYIESWLFETTASLNSLEQCEFIIFKQMNHPNIFQEPPLYKGTFWSFLGGLAIVVDSLEGEMVPGKKIGSKC